ncbi:Radical SAM domain protein [hydrothermal vent metagenome]|uniref:Radical SAM domain protein n=1 Tax=hydrothermal vent metagenome TaxID=652676 RepID=A0A3B0US20_9ZZZZ
MNIFGPVNSRRLGLSLGIDLVPGFCTFNCVYCEINRQKVRTCQRREYIPTVDIITELDRHLMDEGETELDIYTITASGEPTLHNGIGQIIRHIKNHSSKPVAVLTNGSLLHRPEVRQELMAADIIIPSLDTARPASFQALNRPAAGLDIDIITEGIKIFKEEYSGKLWLEILLCEGINDTEADIKALERAVDSIRPDKIQLNTVDRPPLEADAHPLSRPQLERIAARLPGDVEIIARGQDPGPAGHKTARPNNPNEIIELLKRRPCTSEDICLTLNYEKTWVLTTLERLAETAQITLTRHRDLKYWTMAKETNERRKGNKEPRAE